MIDRKTEAIFWIAAGLDNSNTHELMLEIHNGSMGVKPMSVQFSRLWMQFTDERMPQRDTDLAIEQLIATIHKQLVDCPPPGDPVRGLANGHVENLARTIVACLDEYGRVEEEGRA